jgi:hypothetical protein
MKKEFSKTASLIFFLKTERADFIPLLIIKYKIAKIIQKSCRRIFPRSIIYNNDRYFLSLDKMLVMLYLNLNNMKKIEISNGLNNYIW